MKNTKLNILDTARSLFNQQGFSEVTIRMIAMELGISSGNLNYHFKTREDILEALYFEMVETFDKRIEEIKHTEMSFQRIQEDMYVSLKRMIDYRFIWTDLYNLLRLNAKIKSHFLAVHQKRFAGYEYLFEELAKKGWLSKAEFPTEHQYLIERMIEYSNTWLYNSFIYEKNIDDQYVKEQTNILIGMLYPYLTKVGKKKLEEVASIKGH